MARWLLAFQAIDPTNTDRHWAIGIPEWLIGSLRKHGHAKALARMLLVEEVVSGGATQIYSGWSRPEKDDCFVYVGSPDRDYKNLEIETPAPKDMVFLVFVLPDGTIDEWTWRPTIKESDQPQDITGDLIWSLNQE